MTEPSDAAIARRVLGGDREAYRLLVERHRPRLARFAVRMLGNREDAEEALQDAFLRAFRSLAQCADLDRFDGWLFRILANRCRTRGARRSRYEATFVGDDAAVSAAADPAAGPDLIERQAWSDEVARALAGLSEEAREAFLLRYLEELSYEEMAELTGAGVSALKMRVKRACERLRWLLTEAQHA